VQPCDRVLRCSTKHGSLAVTPSNCATDGVGVRASISKEAPSKGATRIR
jgi:hypothetical protein